MISPLLNFSIAGLYSLIVIILKCGSLPIRLIISDISSISNPNAGEGRLVPGKSKDFKLERSMLNIDAVFFSDYY